MELIYLTQGYATMVDDEDHERLSKYKWRFTQAINAKTPYAARGNNETIFMHIDILKYHGLWVPGLWTDHKDRNGLNNQKENLRIATKSENGANSTMHKNNTSGYRGVTWDKAKAIWRVDIRVNDQNKFLGYYVDKHHAARIFNYYSRYYFGEFGFQNDVPD